MMKLYKRIHDNIFYKECWYDGSVAIIHRGVVGSKGITEEYPCESFEQFSAVFLKKFQRQGYRPLAGNELTTIAVRLPFKSEAAAFEQKDNITKMLDKRLGWRGLGHVDGYDIDTQKDPSGNLVLSIFCVVVEESIATREIGKVLEDLPQLCPA